MKIKIFLALYFIFSFTFLFAQSTPDEYRIVKPTAKTAAFSGDHQYETVSNQLANPIRVQVLNMKSEPVSNCEVTFEIVSKPAKSKGFTVKDRVAYTNKDGIAITTIVLGDKPGEYELIARIKNNNTENFQLFKAHGRKSNWVFLLIVGILGGMGIFLFGMGMMSTGMQKSAGDKIRTILSSLTHNRFVAMGVGTFLTMLTQSSSTTAIMLISFVQSGMMKYSQTIGILLGASIGGTITAQLIAFKITEYSLILVALGFGLKIFSKLEKLKQIGDTILGFGLLFFGMYIMSDAIAPIKYYQPFIEILQTLKNPLIGIVIGTVFTAVVQSSGAFIGIIIILASQGILSIEAGIPLMLGTNLGTAVTAILGAVGSKREAQKVAASQTLFKLAGVVMVLLMIPYFIQFIQYISPTGLAKAGGISAMADEVPRQIANAHTVFNILIAIVFIPFVPQIADFINRIMPKQAASEEDELKVLYIDNSMIETPALALNLAKQETLRLAETVQQMAHEVILAFTEKKTEVLKTIAKREKLVDYLYDELNTYIIKVSQQGGQEDRVKEAFQMLYVIKEFEQIGDVISNNLVHYADKWIPTCHQFSEQGKSEILSYYMKTEKQLNRAIEVFRDLNLEKARTMKKKFKKYSEMADEYEKSHYIRMKEHVQESIESNEIHVELMDMMEIINRHATNIANLLLEGNEQKKVNPKSQISNPKS